MAVLLVQWPSAVAEEANVWRVLDLSGITKSVRQSRDYTRAGLVFLDGNHVTEGTRVPLGKDFHLEVRLPTGVVREADIRLVHRYDLESRSPMSPGPTKLNRRG